MLLKSGILWVVATPLGNLGDFSPRAREVLASVDGILAEDTRRTGKLLAECGVSAPPFTSLHDHNEKERLAQALERLQAGKNLALVSDAGTPLVSDPGYLLVKECRKQGIQVRPVPGPSAVSAALSVSGLPPQPFVFLGFLPRKSTDQEKVFLQYASLPVTLVFFERKDRLLDTLAIAFSILSAREGCIAREISKIHEEYIPFTLDKLENLPKDFLGEITVVLGPPNEAVKTGMLGVLTILEAELQKGGKPREVAKRVADRVDGWAVKDIYEYMQSLPR